MTVFETISQLIMENSNSITKVYDKIRIAKFWASRGQQGVDETRYYPNTSIRSVYIKELREILKHYLRDVPKYFPSSREALEEFKDEVFIGDLYATIIPGLFTFTYTDETWMNISIPTLAPEAHTFTGFEGQSKIVFKKENIFNFKKAFEEGDDDLGYDISSSYF